MLDHMINGALVTLGALAVPPDLWHHHASLVRAAVRRLFRKAQPVARVTVEQDLAEHARRMAQLEREFDELG